jgi:hypothetical protein
MCQSTRCSALQGSTVLTSTDVWPANLFCEKLNLYDGLGGGKILLVGQLLYHLVVD